MSKFDDQAVDPDPSKKQFSKINLEMNYNIERHEEKDVHAMITFHDSFVNFTKP